MKFSTKQLKINKANTNVIILISIASAVIVFSVVSSRALMTQRAYQGRVIKRKEQARDQLKSNNDSVKKLSASYETFVNQNTNIIGGLKDGKGDRDGDNAKIILDALPSQYDFPALASSLEKILNINGIKITGINGTDDELNQLKPKAQTGLAQSSGTAVLIPFSISVGGSYQNVQLVIDTLQRSIRPIQILDMTLSGSDNDMSLTVNAKTYYQPSKTLTIKTEVIK